MYYMYVYIHVSNLLKSISKDGELMICWAVNSMTRDVGLVSL